MVMILQSLAWACAAISGVGTLQATMGAALTRRFIIGSRDLTGPEIPTADLPGVTILKPLHGDEPMLETALASFCMQDYPHYQIVFGVHGHDDSAISIVHRLQARFPALEIDLVINPAAHGVNHKVSNLINMYPAARHDVIVMADSDIHAGRDYLRALVQLLQVKGTGLVTTLYAGLPASPTYVRRFGAAQINQFFMPGVLLSRQLGREDCLGATMALHRDTLAQVGGLEALVRHVADDAVLGHKVQDAGLHVALAPCLTETTVAEAGWAALFHHELRWGRTIKNLEPLGYALSSTQLSLFWAMLCVVTSGLAWGAVLFLLATWLIRALAAHAINRALGRPDIYLCATLPLRDWFSALIMLCSLRGRRVAWRGKHLHIRRHVRATSARPKG